MLGHALETAVVLELDRRGADVAYVRGSDRAHGAAWEVDFLAPPLMPKTTLYSG
jgi:hypothetical protein